MNIVSKLLSLLCKLFLLGVAVFAVLFAVYFFNLDMKLTAKMEPLLFMFYDKVKRDQHL